MSAQQIIGVVIIVDGVEVKAYPDNDGNLWYYDPETGRTVIIHE